jgi:hypothetical protein
MYQHILRVKNPIFGLSGECLGSFFLWEALAGKKWYRKML